ncbi:uncharacterized protein [Venturia canescens]|uniref:uncharacterized protein n=1 Tax=Venturia canescens TaxID=32260 RepID=UPI001C9C353C|nr:uncharacterized protein LOC122409690 [Venturia canescens]
MESHKCSMNDDGLEPMLLLYFDDHWLDSGDHRSNCEHEKSYDVSSQRQFKIGRARYSDEIIAHVLISRNHAVVRCVENGDWTIENLSSTITLLNNIPLELRMPKKLFPSNVIQFSASAEFKYEFQLRPKSQINNKRQKLNECFVEAVMTQQKSFAESQETKRKEFEKKLQTKQNEQIELKAQFDELLKIQELSEENSKIVSMRKEENGKLPLSPANRRKKTMRNEKTSQERLLNEKNQLEQKLKETEDALKEQAALTEQLQTTIENGGTYISPQSKNLFF